MYIFHNSNANDDYGVVFGHYTNDINTELVLNNGMLTLRKTVAGQEPVEKILASI